MGSHMFIKNEIDRRPDWDVLSEALYILNDVKFSNFAGNMSCVLFIVVNLYHLKESKSTF